MRSERPNVTVHFAQSLDGRIAIEGQTTALSTREGRTRAHEERASHDAVLVGSNTVRIDDPRLTLREVPGTSPIRVVLASRLDVPREAKVLAPEGRVIVIGAAGVATAEARRMLEDKGARVGLTEPTEAGQVRVDQALAFLREEGVGSLLVEGGARILTSFFRERLVDRLSIETAMIMLGQPATPCLGALGIGVSAAAPTLTNVDVSMLGRNVLVRGDVVWP